MTPEVFIPAVMVALAAFSLLVGYLAAPIRVRTVTKRVVPPELARLAGVFGITEDLPTSDSYGRRIHDILEERDRRIHSLQGCVAELNRYVGELEEEAKEKRAAKRAATTAHLSGWTYTTPATTTPLPGWVDHNENPIEFRANPDWGFSWPTGPHEGYRDVTYRNTKTGKSWTLRTPADTPYETLLALRDIAGGKWTESRQEGGAFFPSYWVFPESLSLYHYVSGEQYWARLGTVSGLAPGYYAPATA